MKFILKTLIVLCMPLLLFGTMLGATSFDLNLNNNSNMNSLSPNISVPNSNNSSSGINIQGGRSIYHTLPEYAPYMPNNGPNRNTPPFEWHPSTKDRHNENLVNRENHFSKMFQNEELNRSTLPSYSRMKEFRLMGLDNQAAQAQLQWEQGIRDSKPIIINGRLRGWRRNMGNL